MVADGPVIGIRESRMISVTFASLTIDIALAINRNRGYCLGSSLSPPACCCFTIR